MSENPDDHPPKRRRILPSPKPNEDQEDNDIEGIFQGMRIYVHDKINPARRRVLRSLITKHGGINSINCDENVTHILVDEIELASELVTELQWSFYIPQNIHVLQVGWVRSCIHANRILNSRTFHFACPRGPMVPITLDSSASENVYESVEASAEDNNGPSGRKFARPKYPRSTYENHDNDERKFWSPLESGSTYDDQHYNCETTCDDEWLLIPLPDPPVCDRPSETAENVEANVEKDKDDLNLKNKGLAKDASKRKNKSKGNKSEKSKAANKVKKANKKKNRKKSEDAAVSNSGPSTSSNAHLPPAKTTVPFDQRPDNTVGRLSRLRLKTVDDPKRNGKKKWVFVNNNIPNESEQPPKEAASNSAAQENSSIKESVSASAAAENNIPDITSISSNAVLPTHEISPLNGEDLQELPTHKDKLSDDENTNIQTTDEMHQQGHKRKKENTSSAEPNEVTNQEKATFERNEKDTKKKIIKHKRKHDKTNSQPVLSDEEETSDETEPIIPKKKKKTRSRKRKDGNTSDSKSSDEQDKSNEKIPFSKTKKTKPEEACLSSNMQGETSNLVELTLSEEKTGKFPSRKLRKSISTPASPVSEGIEGKFPSRKPKKSISTPASPVSEGIEGKFPRRKPKKSISTPASPEGASALPNAESWNFKMDENVSCDNLNSTNEIFSNISADAENMPSSSTTTIPNKKEEIRKYVTDFFAANLLNKDGVFEKDGKRKRSTENEFNFTENPKQSYSQHTEIPSGVPLNLDFAMDVSKGKQPLCQQTPVERSDLNESLAPSQSPKSTLAESSVPCQDNKIPILAECNISEECSSTNITRSVIKFVKTALNDNSSASDVIDNQVDRKAMDQSKIEDFPKDGASNEECNTVLCEENKTNYKMEVDETPDAECIVPIVEKAEDKMYTFNEALEKIADIVSEVRSEVDNSLINESEVRSEVDNSLINESEVRSEVDNSLINETKIVPIELHCALSFDVEQRLAELFFCAKTDLVIAEINFLKAELERRTYGSGIWQRKTFDDFMDENPESEMAEGSRRKSRIGYWESSIETIDSDAAKPISFLTGTHTAGFIEGEPKIVPINGERRSFETPVRGGELLFPLPVPKVITSLPEVVSSDISTDGKEVVKHYLSPLCPNYHIIQKLMQLYQFFKKTKDIWRMHAYEQAIFGLGKYATLITSFEEARSIRGVGNKIAFKVMEIVRTGHLKEIDKFCNTEWVTARSLLTKGYGITPKIARGLYLQNLSNVSQAWADGDLNRTQRLGLKYYEHLSKKMTRHEAVEIAKIIDNYFKIRSKKVVTEACSTIRREKKTCGHVSVIAILPKGVKNGYQLLDDTVAAMHREGYILDDLVRHERNGNQCRYTGLFQINKISRIRRIDLTVVPYIEQVCAKFFLTGPSYFLRAIIRHGEKHDIILDEHCLRLNFLDMYGRVHKVFPLHLCSERDIFNMLDLPYRSPKERDIIPFSTVVSK